MWRMKNGFRKFAWRVSIWFFVLLLAYGEWVACQLWRLRDGLRGDGGVEGMGSVCLMA